MTIIIIHYSDCKIILNFPESNFSTTMGLNDTPYDTQQNVCLVQAELEVRNLFAISRHWSGPACYNVIIESKWRDYIVDSGGQNGHAPNWILAACPHHTDRKSQGCRSNFWKLFAEKPAEIARICKKKIWRYTANSCIIYQLPHFLVLVAWFCFS